MDAYSCKTFRWVPDSFRLGAGSAYDFAQSCNFFAEKLFKGFGRTTGEFHTLPCQLITEIRLAQQMHNAAIELRYDLAGHRRRRKETVPRFEEDALDARLGQGRKIGRK